MLPERLTGTSRTLRPSQCRRSVCTARPDSSAVIETNFSAAHIRTRPNPCEVCAGQSGTGTDLPRSAFGFPLSVSFHH